VYKSVAKIGRIVEQDWVQEWRLTLVVVKEDNNRVVTIVLVCSSFLLWYAEEYAPAFHLMQFSNLN